MLHTFRTAFWAVTLSLLPAGSAGQSGPVRAGTDSVRPVEVAPLTVTGRADDLRGIALSASQGRVGWADLRLRPLLREGELLETVPGVIVTQHSGDGKANQYFVRGFNLDHGTDFQTRVEGMPINLPSHAHGQGYTDLNFLIPELVDHLDFRLGIYHAEFGDFGSAGGVDVHLRDRLERPFATVGLGEGGLRRSAAGGSTRLGAGEILVAGEVKDYDGPWRSPEQLRKRSGVVRYSSGGPARRFTLILLGYRNEWNATDQIPARAVAAGRLGRFGAIDGTDGGRPSGTASRPGGGATRAGGCWRDGSSACSPSSTSSRTSPTDWRTRPTGISSTSTNAG